MIFILTSPIVIPVPRRHERTFDMSDMCVVPIILDMYSVCLGAVFGFWGRQHWPRGSGGEGWIGGDIGVPGG